jgi:ferrous iron transport protein B
LSGEGTIDTLQLPIRARAASAAVPRIALVGNPNAGKTTLFNRLTGLRAKTANFPGTTIERRSASLLLGGAAVELVDLPGLYSLNGATPEERVARDHLVGTLSGGRRPDAVVLLVDASNLERNLYLASQALELEIPVIVALNMVDVAERHGIRIDVDRLAAELGCPVLPIVARTGQGVAKLQDRLVALLRERGSLPRPASACSCSGCPYQARYDWAEEIGERCRTGPAQAGPGRTERIDRFLTHPIVGVAAFLAVMLAVFASIFWIAQYPMDWVERGFALAGATVDRWLPAGDLHSLLVDGVIGGVGGVLVFLPQICILFFFLSLLEDTGYLARAAFVMDRLMRRVGLPGKAFVPMLSAHACAVPAILSTRVIEDRRDRLVTLLVLPLLTCSARIPVYAMLTALLFPHRPLLAGLTFTGAYTLGVAAALGMAFVFKRTILRGETKPLVLELPGYRLPSLRTALLGTFDRAWVFVRNAGTVILLISIALWALATYPRSAAPAGAAELSRQAAALRELGRPAQAALAEADADRLTAQHALSRSFAGRLGHLIEPAIAPLGFDWQIGLGVISSFAAREVIVSTLAVVYGVGQDAADQNPGSLYSTLGAARRADGSPVFTVATCVSLLVFYVLAMQCLPTQAAARRETGGWKWPLFQLGYMSALAYGAALVAYQTLRACGVG